MTSIYAIKTKNNRYFAGFNSADGTFSTSKHPTEFTEEEYLDFINQILQYTIEETKRMLVVGDLAWWKNHKTHGLLSKVTSVGALLIKLPPDLDWPDHFGKRHHWAVDYEHHNIGFYVDCFKLLRKIIIDALEANPNKRITSALFLKPISYDHIRTAMVNPLENGTKACLHTDEATGVTFWQKVSVIATYSEEDSNLLQLIRNNAVRFDQVKFDQIS